MAEHWLRESVEIGKSETPVYSKTQVFFCKKSFIFLILKISDNFRFCKFLSTVVYYVYIFVNVKNLYKCPAIKLA